MDKDTWSRSMVAMLGLDTIGASRMGRFQHADSATPAPARFKRLVLQLKRMIVYRSSATSVRASGVRTAPEGPQRAQRVEEPAPAGLTPEGTQSPSQGSTV